MRYAALLCLLFAGGAAAFSQTLQGVVREADSGQLIAGALVFWENTSVNATSDLDGRFSIARSSESNVLVCHFTGFQDYRQVLPADQTFAEIILELPPMGPTVVIEAKQKAQELNLLDPQKFQTLNEKELCKAACCSLSESFETNASVDASFTDAVTGTRQIKMLGLDGRYTQVMFDNIPAVRGLATIYGLGYLPGPWIREIAISKGAGSVVAGYESITGQINVAHKSSEMKERVFVNAYAGTQGRYEFNTVIRALETERWTSAWHAHASTAQRRFDMNRDGFLDNPLFSNAILRNEWKYTGPRGMRGEYSVNWSHHRNTSGQYDYDPASDARSGLWGVNTTTRRMDVSAKTGYVFPEKQWRSFGSQVNLTWHDQDGVYGLRRYDGEQLSARINLMYASEITEELRFTAGLSYVYDDYRERLDSSVYDRTEQVPGLFSEFTWNRGERLSVVGGIRGDHHNRYGAFVTPRLHARWSVTDRTSVKISAGTGYRTPNIVMDHVGMLAGNRVIHIAGNGDRWPFGLDMERATTMGIVLARKFRILHREAAFTVDLYRTQFARQIVADWETPREIRFYNLEGESWSNSVQTELQWSPVKRMDWRVAYRWLDAQTTYSGRTLLRPLIAPHRFFTNIGYETKKSPRGSGWAFDFTARWLSRQRLPDTFSNPEPYMMHQWGEAYWIFNAQVAYHFSGKFELYAGGENIGNYMIKNPIIAAEDPSSPYFDASMVWGPVFGRMGYAGLRWRIGA
jgi:outer membrane receptor for ferrienterochelin and colicins